MGQVNVNEIRAADNTLTTEINIPAMDQRFAKAWVNFNGSGTISIQDSYNVSSLVDNGVGSYEVNMANAMSNTNYILSSIATGINKNAGTDVSVFTTTAFPMFMRDNSTNAAVDQFVNVAVFSN